MTRLDSLQRAIYGWYRREGKIPSMTVPVFANFFDKHLPQHPWPTDSETLRTFLREARLDEIETWLDSNPFNFIDKKNHDENKY